MEGLKIIKRNGQEVIFNPEKIGTAVSKANAEVDEFEQMSCADIATIASNIALACENSKTVLNVEDIQNLVEKEIMNMGYFEVAKKYITYRYEHELARKANTTDTQILSLLERKNEEVLQENSNKNPIIISTQRDYMAGEVSKDLCRRFIFPKDLVNAHNEGMIWIHDMDYAAQLGITNCCLVNLEDMLQNGTVISGTKIDKPHSFSTACNIATQIIAQVASSQFGGQTISLAHLAPFVDISRKNIQAEVDYEELEAGVVYTEEQKQFIIKHRLKKEIKKGIQMIQYQIITLMTTNGQAPFVSVFMCLGEAKSEQQRKDLALIIEEMLHQRIKGVKNEKGIYITPAFPKLLYVLDEDNISEDSEYWYLTQLAAECTAKRMVPDYISAKKMRELKEGNVFGAMGCAAPDEVVTYKVDGKLFVESIGRMWKRLSDYNDVLFQNKTKINQFMPLGNVEIFDSKLNKFVKCYQMNKNYSNDWYRVVLDHRVIEVTGDHPFETENRGVVHAKDLTVDDKIMIHYGQYSDESEYYEPEAAWTLGTILCDGSYSGGRICLSIASESENEIEERYTKNMKKFFGINTKTILQDRGVKGVYKDICSVADNNGPVLFKEELNRLFEGINKKSRKIPIQVFRWNRNAKVAFLAGMIDADGYIHKDTGECHLGSVNKELAIGQMKLVQALGIPAKMSINHYRGNKEPDFVRYRVNFYPTKEIIEQIACSKKRKNFKINTSMVVRYEIASVKRISKTYSSSTFSKWSYDVTTESEHFEISGIYSHNCRSFLSPYYKDGKPKFYGRFNKGVVTVNLVDAACSSKGDVKKFWEILNERLELCHRALQIRHNRLLGVPSDVAPILWQHGAYARLNKGEKIDKLLTGGYSSLSLGYAGLYECVKYMTGKSHTDKEATSFALSIMKYLKETTEMWDSEEGLGYSLYGTPIESTTYKFAKCLKKRFGEIKGVTDKNYITNSYHVNVTEEIDAFSKLSFESQFQEFSTGGAVSYVEVPNMQNNISAVLELIKHIYNTIMYAEINTKSDYCQECGYTGEIVIEEDGNKLVWVCPNCKNKDTSKMNVARRTCGYIGTNFWNQGRTQEIKERKLHL